MNDEEEEQRIEKLPYIIPKKLRELLNGFKWAISKRNTSAVLIIDGRSGLGKSTLAMQCGRYCDPDYGLHKCHWLPDTFLQGDTNKIGLSEATKGDFILFDEAMIISSRSSLSQINKMIIMAMSMIRSKNIIVCFCVNSIFDLDKNLALSRADLLLSIYGQSLTDRGKFMAFFKGADNLDRLKFLYLKGKKYYDYSKPRANFYTTFSSKFVVDELEYERQKQIAITQFLEQGKSGGDNKASIQRDKLVLWMMENTDKTQKQIADVGGLSERTVRAIKSRYRYLEVMQHVK